MTDEVIAGKYIGRRLPGVECYIVWVNHSPAGLALLHRSEAAGADLAST